MCDSISEKIYLGLNIDVDLFKELEVQSLKYDLSVLYVIEYYIQKGLKQDKKVDYMATINLTEKVMEKVKIRSKQIETTPEELVNGILYDHLRKVEEIPDDIDGERIWNLLDHDKPEGDDILDRITDMF